MVRRLMLLLLLLMPLLNAANSGMRWRVFSDAESATSFRFPYDYRMPDQYRGVLMRPDRKFPITHAPGRQPGQEEIGRLVEAQYRLASDMSGCPDRTCPRTWKQTTSPPSCAISADSASMPCRTSPTTNATTRHAPSPAVARRPAG
ncbi:MAG: hypothetical protein ACOCXA_08615 [Planctomycetota bacterium]